MRMGLGTSVSHLALMGGGGNRPLFDLNYARRRALYGFETYARAGHAWYFDIDGKLKFAPHNLVRNSVAAGVTVGQPTLPTNWGFAGGFTAGLTPTVVGAGIDPTTGYNFIDLRLNGVATSTAAITLFADAITSVAGQSFVGAYYLAVVAGSVANTSGLTMQMTDQGGTGTLVGSLLTLTNLPTRVWLGATMGTGSTQVRPCVRLVPANLTSTIDITIRLCGASLEQVVDITQAPQMYLPTNGATVYGARFSSDVTSPETSSTRHNLIQWSDDATKWNASNGSGGTASTASQLTWSGAGGMGFKLDGAAGAYMLEPNTTYTVNATVQLVTGGTALSFRLYSDSATFQESTAVTITGSLAVYSATFTTPASVTPAGASIQLQWTTNGTWNVTQFSLRKGSLASFQVGGYQQTLGVFAPPAPLLDANVPHNLIRRSKPTGGVPGVVAGGTLTGTMPTDWAVIFNPDAMVVTFNGTGTDSDGDYAEFNIAGNAGANSGGIQISAHGVTAAIQASPIAVGNGGSARYGIKYLTTTGAQGFRAAINETTAAGAYNGAGSSASSFSPSASLQFSTVSRISAATNSACQESFINLFSGLNQTGVNYTCRIYQPQLNLGGLTPYVATTGAVVPPTYLSLGLRIEEARTNPIRNSVAAGAVAGSPGTLPTNWTSAIGNPSGLAAQVVGSGIEDGIPYLDYRISGTATAAGPWGIAFEPTTQIAAASGQTWTSSFFCRLVGGSLANTTGIQNWLPEKDGTGTSLVASTPVFNVTGAPLKTQRNVNTRTLNNAGTLFVTSGVLVTFATGAVIDLTLRIGSPQLEQATFASTPILTFGTSFTRPAENISIPLPPNNGTFTVVGRVRSALGIDLAGGSNQTFFSLDDGTLNNRFQLRRLNGNAAIDAPGVAQAVASGTPAVYSSSPHNADISFWMANAPGDFAVQANGGNGKKTSAAMVSAPTLTTLHPAGDTGGGNRLNGCLAHLAVFLTRKPDANGLALSLAA